MRRNTPPGVSLVAVVVVVLEFGLILILIITL